MTTLTFDWKAFLKTLLPRKSLDALKKTRALYYKGNGVHCPLCQTNFRKFLPGGLHLPLFDKKKIIGGGFDRNCLCPGCFSSQRERLVGAYLKEKASFFEHPRNVLHIAPEKNIEKMLSSYTHLNYIRGDLDPSLYGPNTLRIDITCLPFRDNYFDCIICNHVLEHVPDDKKAMAEMFRVLSPGGWALLQVPLSINDQETYEDFTILSSEEKEQHFGQRDHVRLYGQDYFKRLSKAGFNVEKYSWVQKHGKAKAKQFGIDCEEDLIIAKK